MIDIMPCIETLNYASCGHGLNHSYMVIMPLWFWLSALGLILISLGYWFYYMFISHNKYLGAT